MCANRNVFTDCTRRTNPDYVKRTMFRFYSSCFEVNIDQRIEFGQKNFNVVSTYSRTDYGDTFASQCSCVRYKLPLIHSKGNFIKKPGNFCYPVLVANRDDGITDMFRPQIQVIDTSVRMQNKFCGRKCAHVI